MLLLFFLKTIISFVLSREFINVYNDLGQKYENVTVIDFCKYKKLQCKNKKLKLDIVF